MIGKKKKPDPEQEKGLEDEISESMDEPVELADADEQPEDSPELLLEDARAKADEHWEKCIRLQAELDNLHKRTRRDLENAHKYAVEKFSSELLSVKDSLEMGLAAAQQQDDIDPAKLLEGKELTLKMLTTAMEKFGVSEVNPAGERFNPEFHQAMSMQEREDVEPNTVVTVVQKGYLLHDRLMRPAMVIVSKAMAQKGDTKIDERA